MNPAFSVILLTTLIGAGQGLLLALVAADLAAALAPESALRVVGGTVSVALTVAGLVASTFHLGRPERGWRAASQWRTSWLSREVIALPLFMGAAAAWTLAQWLGWSRGSVLLLGLLAAAACVLLFVCTAMIYASLRFLQEWASPLTLVNYTVLGVASGCTLAAALAALIAPALASPFGVAAMVFTATGLVTRVLSLVRNARIQPKSTLRTAIGIRHPVIRQRAMGFMGGSFNTREFFHGQSAGTLRWVRDAFLVGAFLLPLGLLALGLGQGGAGWPVLAFVVQFAGLLAERWYFFAQANHPQNLYYQSIA